MVNTLLYISKNKDSKEDGAWKDTANEPENLHISFNSCLHPYHEECWKKYATSN